MFRTLAVPLDGSALAERALPYAIRLAQAAQGRLILVRAALAAPPARPDGSNWKDEQQQAISVAEKYLREMAESVSGRLPRLRRWHRTAGQQPRSSRPPLASRRMAWSWQPTAAPDCRTCSTAA